MIVLAIPGEAGLHLGCRSATTKASATPNDPSACRNSAWNTSACPEGEAEVSIHPSAIVARGAELGSGVSIGPWCSVGANAVIDDGTRLVSHVVVDGHTVIGPDVVLFPFCTVGLEPQDPEIPRRAKTRCEIGARTQIREHCTIHRGTVTGRGDHPRRRGLPDHGAVAHVAHDCQVGDHVIIANNAVMGGHVRHIADHAVIGGAAAIHQFVRIGRAAMIGGTSPAWRPT